MPHFGNIVRAARSRSGKTLREVSVLIDVDASRISQWENGHVEPKASALYKYIAAELMTADEAFGVVAIDDSTVAA